MRDTHFRSITRAIRLGTGAHPCGTKRAQISLNRGRLVI